VFHTIDIFISDVKKLALYWYFLEREKGETKDDNL